MTNALRMACDVSGTVVTVVEAGPAVPILTGIQADFVLRKPQGRSRNSGCGPAVCNFL